VRSRALQAGIDFDKGLMNKIRNVWWGSRSLAADATNAVRMGAEKRDRRWGEMFHKMMGYGI
jgi:hypothetical protein